MKLMHTRGGRIGGAVVLGIGITAAPVVENCMMERTAHAQEAQRQSGAPQQAPAYSSRTNPFGLNQRLRDIAREISENPDATARQKVDKLFETLRSGAENGVRVVDASGRPPRTAIETYEQGGDCSELANLAIALLKQLNIPGGAYVVHFNSAPADVYHMVPYVQIGNDKIVMDLQADSLGATATGAYTTLLTLTFSEAAYIYHAEWGDYLMGTGDKDGAIKAYEAAVAICDRDAFVHHNLAVLYEEKGDMEKAGRHSRRAAELAPDRYGQYQARGTYNEELQAGGEAAEAGRWADCVRHLQNALDSGERLSAEERHTIEQYRDTCAEQMRQ